LGCLFEMGGSFRNKMGTEIISQEDFENLVYRYGTNRFNPIIDSFLKIDRERLKREFKFDSDNTENTK